MYGAVGPAFTSTAPPDSGRTYRHRVRLSIRRVAAALALVLTAGSLAAPTAPASAATYATIEGSGSTWAQTIVNQWVADVDASGIRVVYTGGGSSRGRTDFAQNTTDFAVSEIAYQGTDEVGQPDTSNGREHTYVPLTAGGIAFTYQLKVGDTLVKNIRLSGRTLALIFTNQITNWNDPAISHDNNGRTFPDKPVIPVVRADGAGATAQLTAWMDQAHPTIWRSYSGASGPTSFYPRKGDVMVARSGSDQVMNTVSGFAGDGTIGYVEYSYPLDRGAPVVKVLNKGGYYVEPTQDNTAVALTKARINADQDDPLTYQTQDLTGVYTNPDPRAYPISYYSYLIIPTGSADPRMTTAKRQSLADFATYALCKGQTKSGAFGYGALPLNLVRAGFDQIARLKTADPAVDLVDHDVAHCDNPTFDKTNLEKDLLTQIAPLPAACDKQGAGPCSGAQPDPPAPVRTRISFQAPRLQSGVYVVNPARRYALTVRTTAAQRPHYLHAVRRDLPFRGSGTAFRSAGTANGQRVWTLRVQVRPGAGTKKLGVRIGRTTRVMLVRRA